MNMEENFMTFRLTAMALAAAGLALAPAGLSAQDAANYPERPVNLVVPYAPGGSTDAAARLLAPSLGERFGQPFVVENRPGASGTVGTDYVARSEPNGERILVHTSVIGIHPAFHEGLTYDTIADLEPVSIVAGGPFVLVAHPSLPADTVEELAEYARQNPGEINFGSAGAGSSGHLIGELFKNAAGIDMLHVPYAGGGPSQVGLLANEVQIVFDTLTSIPLINDGRLKALAVTSPERWPALPDVPTIAEAGYPDVEILIWIGAFAPAGTPEGIVDALSTAMAEAVNEEATVERLFAVGMTPIGSTPEEAVQQLADDIAIWQALKDTGNVVLD